MRGIFIKRAIILLTLLGVVSITFRSQGAACNFANGSGLIEVTWQTYTGNTPLDRCPKNWGKRIFPGRKNPTDSSSDRAKVRARASIMPATAGQTVYFKFFDVDDPSTSTVIDSNGTVGGDNKGAINYPSISAVTDASGYATVEYTVSRQPGDNYKVFAACTEADLTTLTQQIVDSGNTPGNIVESKELTTWRRLWLEFDSMDTVATTGAERNYESGTIDSVAQNSPLLGQSKLDVGHRLLDEANRYELGDIVIDGVIYWVDSNTDKALSDDDVVVNAVVPLTAVGKEYLIYDDDYYLMTLQLTLPYTLSGGSLISLAFSDAYILPVDAGHVDKNSTFYRNLNWGFYSKVTEKKDLTDTPDFWVVHLLAAWQADKDEDNDPDSQNAVLGTAILENNNTGAIFMEVVQEFRSTDFLEWQTICHEIGHQGGARHADGGIMAANPSLSCMKFADETIDRFRREGSF